MLVTGQTRRVDVPHEPTEWFEVRRLSWREMEEAGVIAASRKVDNFDPDTVGKVLLKGILAWSYDAPVNEDTVGALDLVTAGWATTEILQGDQGQAASKNG